MNFNFDISSFKNSISEYLVLYIFILLSILFIFLISRSLLFFTNSNNNKLSRKKNWVYRFTLIFSLSVNIYLLLIWKNVKKSNIILSHFTENRFKLYSQYNLNLILISILLSILCVFLSIYIIKKVKQ